MKPFFLFHSHNQKDIIEFIIVIGSQIHKQIVLFCWVQCRQIKETMLSLFQPLAYCFVFVKNSFFLSQAKKSKTTANKCNYFLSPFLVIIIGFSWFVGLETPCFLSLALPLFCCYEGLFLFAILSSRFVRCYSWCSSYIKPLLQHLVCVFFEVFSWLWVGQNRLNSLVPIALLKFFSGSASTSIA